MEKGDGGLGSGDAVVRQERERAFWKHSYFVTVAAAWRGASMGGRLAGTRLKLKLALTLTLAGDVCG